MVGMEGNSASTIDVRESRLRVLAACAATTIAGWDLFAATQIGGATGRGTVWWIAGTFWGAVCCAVLVARALGRERTKAPWLFALAYSMNLPFVLFLAARLGLGLLPPSAEANVIAAHNPGYAPLALGSSCGLIVVAIVGYRLEPKRLFSDRRFTD
jgi:hypothetical protein